MQFGSRPVDPHIEICKLNGIRNCIKRIQEGRSYSTKSGRSVAQCVVGNGLNTVLRGGYKANSETTERHSSSSAGGGDCQ